MFEAELGRQILASERERAGLEVLMGLAIFVALAVVNLIDIARGEPLPAFKWALIYRHQLPLGPSEPPESKVGYVMRPVFLLFGGIIAGLVAARIRSGILRSLHAAEERRRIVQMFGQHVSPAVVNQLLAQPTGL